MSIYSFSLVLLGCAVQRYMFNACRVFHPYLRVMYGCYHRMLVVQLSCQGWSKMRTSGNSTCYG